MINKLEYKIEKVGDYTVVKLFKNSRMVTMTAETIDGLVDNLSKKARDIYVRGVFIKREKYENYKKLSISNLDTKLTIAENLEKYDIILVEHEELLDMLVDIKLELDGVTGH